MKPKQQKKKQKKNDIDINDVDPNLVNEVRHWYQTYKLFEGKKENRFAFDGIAQNRKYTWKVIEETHKSWKNKILPKLNKLSQDSN